MHYALFSLVLLLFWGLSLQFYLSTPDSKGPRFQHQLGYLTPALDFRWKYIHHYNPSIKLPLNKKNSF